METPGNHQEIVLYVTMFIFSNQVIIPSFLLFVRFWKMASTFTGLKLQGLMGHFGKTTATDIEGYVELPDGKVCVPLFSQVGFVCKSGRSGNVSNKIIDL